MNIALIIEHFDAARGGAEHVAVWLAGELATRGHEVHVLCHDAKSRPIRAAHQGASHDATRSENAHGRETAEAPNGVHVHKFRGLKLSTGIGFKLFGQMAKKWCKRHRPDVVHSLTVAWAADLYHPEAGVYARMQQQAIRSRTTRTRATLKRLMQRFSGKQRALLALERRAVRPWAPNARWGNLSKGGPWKIISISPGTTREFREHYDLAPERMTELDNPHMKRSQEQPDSVEARAWFRAHYGLSETDRVALFIGHDFRRKGLRWAIEAIARTKTNWKMLVVGLGKVREYFELADQLNLVERVKFVGPTREVDRLYYAGDALLLPVFYDPAPLVVIGALSAGMPVISTSHLGSAELVRRNRVGAIVNDPHEVDAMAAALDALPVEPKERAAMAARAREAAKGISPETFVDKIVELYHACAAAKKRAS